MRHFFQLVLGFALAAFVGLSSCSSDSDESAETEDSSPVSGYANGTYCAEVTYYYSPTGTNSTYTLLVDVEDNHLVKIHWPNGGWLDQTHYNGPDIEDGDASFTSDVGADYTVRIQGEEGSCSTDSNATGEADVVQEHEDQLQANATEETRVQQEEAEDHRRQVRQEAEEEEERQAQQREEEQRRRNEASTESEEE
ncbi:MAG: hypothetical protein EOO60_06760 [Hymenobacter sp.]|nr:MAG: hypothetical protein EOO60_06760 [Hymenobacter sp.]